MEISKKNNIFKKILILSMAAAMLPSMVTPTTVEAAPTVGLHTNWNIKMNLDGKQVNDQWAGKIIRLVDSTNSNTFYTLEATTSTLNKIWVPAGKIYKIYDLTGYDVNENTHKTLQPKAQIKVDAEFTTIATLNYSTLYASDVKIMPDSYAYYEDKNKPYIDIKGIYKDPNAKLLVNNQEKIFKENISAHGPASIKYDLTKLNANRLTGYIGLDTRRNEGTVQVEILVDGVPVITPLTQDRNQNATFVDIPLKKDAEILEIKVTGKTDATNPNKDAMFVFGDAKFYKN